MRRLSRGLRRWPLEERLTAQPGILATHRRLEGFVAVAAPDPEAGWRQLRAQLEDRPFGLLQRLSMWARRPAIGVFAAGVLGTGGAYAADLGPVRAGADRLRAGLERIFMGGDADGGRNSRPDPTGPERGGARAPVSTPDASEDRDAGLDRDEGRERDDETESGEPRDRGDEGGREDDRRGDDRDNDDDREDDEEDREDAGSEPDGERSDQIDDDFEGEGDDDREDAGHESEDVRSNEIDDDYEGDRELDLEAESND